MKRILIISLDTPWPDNYGGARDIWTRACALREGAATLDLVATYKDLQRVKAFEASPERATFDHCLFVHRRFNAWGLLLPFGVASRIPAPKKRRQIGADLGGQRYDAVLVEGVQCLATFVALRGYLSYARAYMRVHNRESRFLLNSFRAEPRLGKRLASLIDSARYAAIEGLAPWRRWFHAGIFISRDEIDEGCFAGFPNRVLVPPLRGADPAAEDVPFDAREDTVLYVGNLNLADNRAALQRAYQQLRPALGAGSIRLKVLGRCEDPSQLSYLAGDRQVETTFNATKDALKRAYATAKLFLNVSSNAAGVKLKLYDAVAHGLPVASDANGVAGSGFEDVVAGLNGITPLLSDAGAWTSLRTEQRRRLDEMHQQSRANFLSLLLAQEPGA